MERLSERLTASLLCLAALVLGGQTVHSQTTQYDLSVKILPAARRLEVAGTMLLPAATEAREQVEFYLSPKMGRPEVKLVGPETSAPLTLLSSKEEGGDIRWVFSAGRRIPPGRRVRVRFSYSSENKTAPQFDVTPEGAFAGGGGELWYPQVSFKNRETGRLRFQVPPGETVVATGVLRSSEAQQARGDFTYSVTLPSKFAFASGRYSVVKRKGRVPFNLYLLRPRPQSRSILEGSSRALEILTDLFGRFPYREFSLVEVKFPTIVRGTGEYGLIFANSAEMDDFDLSYWAHEIGHQWWGNVVRSRPGTTGQMMLSEGVTQFGSLLAVEAVEGEEAAARFRRGGYRGGPSAAGYFKLAQSGTDLPLTTHLPQNQDETLRMHRLANSKGFILLDMLSRRIGRERFAAILRQFIRAKKDRLTSWEEFREAVEAGAGDDVGWFFEQWFERTGAPDYRLNWKQEGDVLHAEISQPAPHFRATLEVEIAGSGRRLVRTVEITDGRVDLTVAAPFKVETVVLDPQYKVLRWLPEFRGKPPVIH